MVPRKVKEELLIFEQLAHIAQSSDPVWVNFYKLCAQGKFPPKVKIFERSLVFRRSTRPVVFALPSEATQEEFERCNRFFREDVGVSIGQAVATQSTAEVVPLAKRILRLKKLRNIQLLLYTKMVAERDGLNQSQRDQLFSVIALGWLSGLIHTRSLRIESPDGGPERIVDIQGIQRDEEGKFFIYVAPTQKVRVRGSGSSSRPKNTINDQWLVYTNRAPRARATARDTAADDGTDDITSQSELLF